MKYWHENYVWTFRELHVDRKCIHKVQTSCKENVCDTEEDIWGRPGRDDTWVEGEKEALLHRKSLRFGSTVAWL